MGLRKKATGTVVRRRASSTRMLRVRGLLVAVALLGACLPAFAPGIRAAKHHRGVGASAPDASCLGCHPTQRESEASGFTHGDAPIVATWMIEDRRGCVGCHRVREPRR